jgi:hypothetical protein
MTNTGNDSSKARTLEFIALGFFPLIFGVIALSASVGTMLGFWSRPSGPDTLAALACFVVGYVACVTLPMLHRRIATLETAIAALQNERPT